MQKIVPFPWFNGNAEEAMNFYLSIFKNPQKADRVMRAMMQMKKLDIKGLQQAYDRG